MRYPALLLAAAVLSGCAWETYQNAEGKTTLRPKYEKGARVYYQDGTYSPNMNYNQYRPEPHAVKPAPDSQHEVRRTTWEKPSK
ncbi:spore cortex protein [Neisseria animalis]|uniref:Spore cortex protein n=1 Tax=Neisseria animalis TaxID=492 RepID=A0A5P3MST3_NEIAN|nr:spore cortex protein [Neisseria animalis]QEY23851.1 spore cortex protein [Neisseria animalis]ROW32081.1 spore cortex protein [Neisseria animalis]VEE05704.1 lipoprotein [Neisseria animalis]